MKKTPINQDADRTVVWSTASFGSAADASPLELAVLGAHLRRCALERGALFPLKSAAESLSLLLSPRPVTVVVLFTLLSILASLVL